MKILYALPYGELNPFLDIIANRLAELDNTIKQDSGTDLFWNEEALQYDIIHIMWPELYLISNHQADEIKKRLIQLKEKGIKIVSTCHNLTPHMDLNASAIDVTYENSDAIFHLGKYSYDLLKEKYPLIKHFITPHHIYDDRYKSLPERKLACQKLNLNPKIRYAVCFGEVRNTDEIKLILSCAKGLLFTDYKILIPRRIYALGGKRRRILNKLLLYLKHPLAMHHIKMFEIPYIPDEDLPFFFSVSDIVIIQRLKILNSGNLPLGMYLGKVIVGPNKGNVNTILQETSNFIFDVNNPQTIQKQILMAFSAYEEGQGNQNRKYALDNWSSNKIAYEIQEHYRNILNS